MGRRKREKAKKDRKKAAADRKAAKRIGKEKDPCEAAEEGISFLLSRDEFE